MKKELENQSGSYQGIGMNQEEARDALVIVPSALIVAVAALKKISLLPDNGRGCGDLAVNIANSAINEISNLRNKL